MSGREDRSSRFSNRFADRNDDRFERRSDSRRDFRDDDAFDRNDDVESRRGENDRRANRGLERAQDRIDAHQDRFQDRTGRTNRGLDNAADRIGDNLDRFEDRFDDANSRDLTDDEIIRRRNNWGDRPEEFAPRGSRSRDSILDDNFSGGGQSRRGLAGSTAGNRSTAATNRTQNRTNVRRSSDFDQPGRLTPRNDVNTATNRTTSSRLNGFSGRGDTRDASGTLVRDRWSDLGDTRDSSGGIVQDRFSDLNDTRDESGSLMRDRWSDLGDTRDRSGVLMRDRDQRTTGISGEELRRSGFRGLDRAIDQLDTNADRFRDRTGRVNQGLENARDRLRDNRFRADGDTDFSERD